MALLFSKVERANPNNRAEPKKWYPVLKRIAVLEEREVAVLLADETTLNPKEAEMAIHQFEKILLRSLLDGKTVRLGSVGTFQLTINSREGVAEAKLVSAAQIKKVNLRFIPSADVREALNKATFKPAKDVMSQAERDL